MPMVTVEGSAVVVVADPDQLTIAETGCRGETHRVRLVDAASIGAAAPSGKAHPRTEGDDEVLSAIPETAEPFPLVLENALAREAVLTHDGVQPRLGGVGLPPTIVKGDALIGDLSDQIAMEADLSDVPVHGDAGVSGAPVTTLGDRGVHLAFDLAHGWLRLVDVASIGSPDVLGTDAVTVYPLALGVVAREPEHLENLQAVNVGVAVLGQRT